MPWTRWWPPRSPISRSTSSRETRSAKWSRCAKDVTRMLPCPIRRSARAPWTLKSFTTRSATARVTPASSATRSSSSPRDSHRPAKVEDNSVNRKKKFSYVSGCCVLVAILVFPQFSFPQTSASTPPAQNQKAATPASSAQQLTPPQMSQLERALNDWPFLAKYRDADKELPPPAPAETRVVFMGDSITEGWGRKESATSPDRAEFFPDKPYINRGISGQITPQMLVRFRQDVIDLQPKVVVLLAGTNDIAENTGKTTPR